MSSSSVSHVSCRKIISLLSQSCLMLSAEVLTLRQLYEVILNNSAVNVNG